MQGRLSNPINGKIQSFPFNNWEKEFEVAQEIGYGCIEWVIDSSGIDKNPLFDHAKHKIINKLIKKYSISIPAVCHDLLMDLPLFSSDNDISRLSQNILLKTMEICESIGINFIELPCVGNSSIKDDSSTNKLVEILSGLDNKAKQYGIHFILETDLNPEDNVKLMKKMNGISVGLNFDMGNSAYWGFDTDYELPLIGEWIKNVHVKDCTPKDYTLPLGNGNVDFTKVFRHLKNQNYDGLFILQAAPAPLGQEFEIAKKYFQFTKNHLINFHGS